MMPIKELYAHLLCIISALQMGEALLRTRHNLTHTWFSHTLVDIQGLSELVSVGTCAHILHPDADIYTYTLSSFWEQYSCSYTIQPEAADNDLAQAVFHCQTVSNSSLLH